MSAREKPGRVQICVWVDLAQLQEIDRRVAEKQFGVPTKVHRSDILKEALDAYLKPAPPQTERP